VTRVVLASNNAGKLREFAELLSGAEFQVLPQSQFGIAEAEETGATFAENAVLKARHASSVASLPAIADDSGLEVDALHGAPGVYSARYAGAAASDRNNIQRLLQELRDVPEGKRSARFRCVICYVEHGQDPSPVICRGTWEGRILMAPRGRYGFGYDPIFLVPAYGCSAAELSPQIKNRISHRAQALRTLLATLRRGEA
jgi:XTP/dITP diphosphohydrolase